MKAVNIFSPTSWRKRKQKTDISSSPGSESRSSTHSFDERPKLFRIGSDYSVKYAQSAVNLGSPEKSFDEAGQSGSPPEKRSTPFDFRKRQLSTSSTIPSTIPRPGFLRRHHTEHSPRRPPRPPSLNLDGGSSSTSLIGVTDHYRDMSSESFHSLGDFPRQLVESGRSTDPRNVSKAPLHRLQTEIKSSNSIRPKGSMPELDGVWKGFLEDVDEDLHSLGVSQTAKQTRRRSNTVGHLGKSKRFQDLPPSPSFNKQEFDLVRPPAIVRSESSPILGQELTIDDASPTRDSFTEPSSPIEFSLSLFPSPPPLVIRKTPPKPLALRSVPSLATIPSSPSTPSSSSSDSTPVTTPTTPTPSSHLPRSFKGPTSILKNPRLREPSSEISPISSARPSKPSLSLRPTHFSEMISLPNNKLPLTHRTTSSDSASSTSTSTSSEEDLSRERMWTFPIRRPFNSTLSSYLPANETKSTPRPLVPPPPVQWGLAV